MLAIFKHSILQLAKFEIFVHNLQPFAYMGGCLTTRRETRRKKVVFTQSTSQLIQCSEKRWLLIILFIKVYNQQMQQNEKLEKKEVDLVHFLSMVYTLIIERGIDEIIPKAKNAFINMWWLDIVTPQIIKLLALIETRLEYHLRTYNVKRQSNQHLACLHFCLAIIMNKLNDHRAKQEYEMSLRYNPSNPQILLLLALYHSNHSGIEYLDRIDVYQMIKEQHRERIANILSFRALNLSHMILSKSNSKTGGETQKSFITKVCEKAALFYHKSIQIDTHNHQYYIDLAKTLNRLNRFDEALHWANALKLLNPQDEEIQLLLGSLYGLLGKQQERVDCARSVLRINPKSEDAYSQLNQYLIPRNHLEEAKHYAFQLISINKHNCKAYQQMGRIFQKERRYGQSLYCLGLALSLHNRQQQTFFYLGELFAETGWVKDAKAAFLKSLIIQPDAGTYNSLGAFLHRIGEQLSAIECFQQAIKLQYLSIIPYLNLSLRAKENAFWKSRIGQFMEELREDNLGNLHISFLVALYFYLSRQSSEEFHDFMASFLTEGKDGTGESIYSDIVANTLIQYQNIPKQSRQTIRELTMIIGILSRVKGDRKQAHSCFSNIFSKYKREKESASTTFTRMWESEFKQTPRESLPFFLEFMATEVLQEDPEQAKRCYIKARNYAEGDYTQFQLEMHRAVSQKIEDIDCIAAVMEMVKEKQYNKDEAKLHASQHSIIGLSNFAGVLKKAKDLLDKLKSIEWLDSSDRRVSDISRLLFDVGGRLSGKEKKVGIKRAFPGLAWSSEIADDSCYFKLYGQIRLEEHNVESAITNLARLYSRECERKTFLRSVALLLEEYFDRFAVNNAIRLIFSNISPFIFTEAEEVQFAEALLKFKNSPEYSYSLLKDELHCIFQKDLTKQQEMEQSQMESLISTESDLSEDQLQIVRNFDTKSQQGETEQESELFTQCKPKSIRKYSDSILSSADGNGFQKYLQEMAEKAKGNALRAIFVPFQSEESKQNEKKQERIKDRSFSSAYHFENFQGQQLYSEIVVDGSQETSSQNNSMSDIQWFPLHYTFRSIKFKNDRLYSNFRCYLYQHIFLLIKSLSRNKLRYIARHSCTQKTFPDPFEGFEASVELGRMQRFQENALDWIWMLGPAHIFGWIKDIALGVEELESLGIYHADLWIRNTIKIVADENKCSFKVIDFDKAFKVFPTEEKDKAFESTKNLLDHWIRFKFDGVNSKPPMDEIEVSDSQGKSKTNTATSTFYNERDIIEYIYNGADESLLQQLIDIRNKSKFSSKRVDKCIRLLQAHMRKSHLQQYTALVKKLLNEETIKKKHNKELVDKKTVEGVLKELQQLEEGKIGYSQFSAKVGKISGYEEQKDKESDPD